MSFFEDLHDSIVKAASTVTKAGCEVTRQIKVSIDIVGVKTSIEEKQLQIGKLVCQASEGVPAPEGEITALMSEISALNEELKQLRQKEAELKFKKICSSCGCSSKKDQTYCGGCGGKL